MITALGITAAIIGGTKWYLSSKVFGSLPKGLQKEKVLQSPYYLKGKFQNLQPTYQIRPDVNYWKMTKDFFGGRKHTYPPKPIPHVKAPLSEMLHHPFTFNWFGHSSYLLQINGKHFLVDPVLSGSASPVKGFGKAYPGSDAVIAEDLPFIDYLIITHDHYDHLDYSTLKKIMPKVGKVITHLGVGSHLLRWGFAENIITELEWWGQVGLEENLAFTSVPGRHFSGRQFKTAQSLWGGFVLQTDTIKVLIGGDSGYDDHFKLIGEKFQGIDLAILECGQYGMDWPLIHMTPEETAQAAIDLGAKRVIPVHWAKFSLALHQWDDPIDRFLKASENAPYSIVTPYIGQIIQPLNEAGTPYWWKHLDGVIE